MARPSDGKIRKADSRCAAAAHIAARLSGTPFDGDADFFREKLRLNLSAKSGRDAIARWNEGGVRTSSRLIRRWLLVDEPGLDLDVAVLRFEGTGVSQPGVTRSLRGIPGVRQILQLAGRGDVIAVCVFDGARARRELRAQIEERIEGAASWDEVELESWEPAVATWSALARRLGDEEALSLGTETA